MIVYGNKYGNCMVIKYILTSSDIINQKIMYEMTLSHLMVSMAKAGFRDILHL